MVDNNKGRMKDRGKSNPEQRKVEPKDHADVGIVNGHKIGVKEGYQKPRE